MKQVLRGLEGVTVYLGNIIIHGPSNAKHDCRLEKTLERLADYHLTLNSKKCSFEQTEIEFMGYRIDASWLKPIHSKIEAIVNIPIPTNTKELASFLGVVGYYSRLSRIMQI